MNTVYGQFERAAHDFPDKTALLYLGTRKTYSQLREGTERLAANLLDLGVTAESKAILYLPNCPQWVMAWLALVRLGAVSIPVSPIYTPSDLRYMITDSGSETIFCLDTNFGYVSHVLAETGLKRIIITNMAEPLSWLKRWIGIGFDKIPRGKIAAGENIFSFKSLLKNSPPSRLPPLKAESRDMFEMLYTGGTTGLPKGVPFSHAIFIQSAMSQRSMSEKGIPKGKDVVIQGGPLFHILGQAMGIGALFSGDALVLLPRVNMDGLFHHVQRYKASTFFGVPTMYRMILEHDRIDDYDLSSLKYCFSGGDVLPVEVGERWLKKFGVPIYQGYGATETCGGVSLTNMEDKPPLGTVGKIVGFQKVKLVEPETLEPVPPGEPGELLVSSENMVSSYWNKPEETAACFVEMDGRRWYKTRDIVRIDDEGWLFYTDRSVDTIKHKGYRVASSEVEAVLQGHHAVVASCVVGIKDEKVGERIKAFVVLKKDIKGVSAQDLTRWCRERLAPYKVPQYIEFRDMLPKSKVGKLLRRELRAEERKKTEKV